MYEIKKQFDFCYGHRVWNQQLNVEFSEDSCLACRHLHGHQGTIIVGLKAEKLQSGMVTDFKHLNWFKKWLDENLDHKFIFDENDPLLPYEIPSDHIMTRFRRAEGHVTFHELNQFPQPLKEKYEGMILVPFIPTSENLSKWFYQIIQNRMGKIGVEVSSIQFFETPKSQSIYTPKN